MFIPDRVKTARLEKGYSQKELGNLIGVSDATINGYEKGGRKPTLVNLIKLSELLELTPNYILGFDKLLISEDEEEYNIHLSKEEIEFIKEARKKKKTYNRIITEPKRLIESIERNVIN